MSTDCFDGAIVKAEGFRPVVIRRKSLKADELKQQTIPYKKLQDMTDNHSRTFKAVFKE